jgi:cold shock CspA family protein
MPLELIQENPSLLNCRLNHMQTEDTLTKWNDDRGFGFITPRQYIFAHISAFLKDGRRPQLNERVSFEISTDKGGKKRAVNVSRPRSKKTIHPRLRSEKGTDLFLKHKGTKINLPPFSFGE